jgi:predicted nicotinamide N-methyase
VPDRDRNLVEEVVALGGGRELAVLRPRDGDALIDEDAFARGEFLPYWAQLWPSGVALARLIAPRALKRARVVEVGCGLGLPSLAAALAGARVLATDWSPAALALLAENAERNGARLELAAVDWTAPQALLDRDAFDLVLAADVLYERRAVPVLADLLPRLGREVLLADPGRPQLEDFLERTGTVWRRPPVFSLAAWPGGSRRRRRRAAAGVADRGASAPGARRRPSRSARTP